MMLCKSLAQGLYRDDVTLEDAWHEEVRQWV